LNGTYLVFVVECCHSETVQIEHGENTASGGQDQRTHDLASGLAIAGYVPWIAFDIRDDDGAFLEEGVGAYAPGFSGSGVDVLACRFAVEGA
jgi:hypothetical protein